MRPTPDLEYVAENTTALPAGVWPVMLTPFTADGAVDWPALDRLVEWYIGAGVAGLFAVCLSSEMYALSQEERLAIAGRVVARSAGRVPVVATGTFGGPLGDQADSIHAMAGTGVAAVVVMANQLAAEGEDETVWRANLDWLLRRTGSVPLGLYECPVPYHRRLTPGTLGWAAGTGRFRFHKDTACAMDGIRAKIAAAHAADPAFRWFNAHGPSLLDSLAAGGDGYSGIAANCFPRLHVGLCANHRARPAEARRIQRFLSLADPLVRLRYPASAKRFLALRGLAIGPRCRIAMADAGADDDEALLLAHLSETLDDLTATLP
jgi:4-hydroxy-tetrahydrodipicolinate synthase